MPQASLVRLCREYGVRRLSLFGSILRPDFAPGSDIDMLVEFLPGTRLGLRFFELQEKLTVLLGRRVDLNTPASLSPAFRDQVLGTAQVQYEFAA